MVQWCHGVVVMTTTQLHSTKPELKFCAGSNCAPGLSGIHNGKNLWQCSGLKINFNAFCWPTMLQKQFIIIKAIISNLFQVLLWFPFLCWTESSVQPLFLSQASVKPIFSKSFVNFHLRQPCIDIYGKCPFLFEGQ